MFVLGQPMLLLACNASVRYEVCVCVCVCVCFNITQGTHAHGASEQRTHAHDASEQGRRVGGVDRSRNLGHIENA